MLKISKFFSYFIVSISLHTLFFFFIFCKKNPPVYLFTPVDVTFYLPDQNMGETLASVEKTSIDKIKDTSNVKKSAKKNIKERAKKLDKIKDDILVKKGKNPVKKVTGTQENNNAKNKKTTGKTLSKPSAPIETAKPLESDVSLDSNVSLYTGTFFDTKDFKYPYYTNQIRKKVAAQWRWVESHSNLRVLLYFKINRDGSVEDILVKESSGNKDYDTNALCAIRRASPFSELPSGYEGKSLGVFFEIKY